MPTDTAYSGQEGIAKVKERMDKGLKPHKLILTDINMPEMDGFQMSDKILKIIRDRFRNVEPSQMTCIVAVTAMNDTQIREKYQKYGIK